MTDSGTMDFHFDYVDPLSYLLHRRLQELERSGEISLRPLPLELNPPPNPLLDPESPAFRKRWQSALREEPDCGIPTGRPWIVPWTRKAHELGAYARERNCFEEIHESLFHAYLIGGLDIGRVDVLVKIAEARGLDPRETKAVLDVDRHRNAIEEIRFRSVAEGMDTPPVLSWNDRTLTGCASPEALRSFLAAEPESDQT